MNKLHYPQKMKERTLGVRVYLSRKTCEKGRTHTEIMGAEICHLMMEYILKCNQYKSYFLYFGIKSSYLHLKTRPQINYS